MDRRRTPKTKRRRAFAGVVHIVLVGPRVHKNAALASPARTITGTHMRVMVMVRMGNVLPHGEIVNARTPPQVKQRATNLLAIGCFPTQSTLLADESPSVSIRLGPLHTGASLPNECRIPNYEDHSLSLHRALSHPTTTPLSSRNAWRPRDQSGRPRAR